VRNAQTTNQSEIPVPAASSGGDVSSGSAGWTLENGSRVAVVGGGPAGSFFAYFLLRLAEMVDLELEVDIYEPRAFTDCGPAGCNHCGGIVSESLVQLLASEGIVLPSEIVQRGIDSYELHMDVGDVRILTPLEESRIAAVYRGNGPRTCEPLQVAGFDRFLQDMAAGSGATVRRQLVDNVAVSPEEVRVDTVDGDRRRYDLLAVAAGINSGLVRGLDPDGTATPQAGSLTTFICEFRLGLETVERTFGNSMHVFLLDLPRLEFAALIPKGEFVTMCMLGHNVDAELVEAFLADPVVRRCFPEGRVPPNVCHCFPRINVRANPRPYGDRYVLVGDSGVARLYKDGIGSAYRTAKAAAMTAVLHGISGSDFARNFAPTCRSITSDNNIGRAVFAASHLFQKFRFSRRAILRMTRREQARAGDRPMSGVLWDVFSGSAPYRDILRRSLRPAFLGGVVSNLVAANFDPRARGSQDHA
jgi:flavin-dependent dehydrogenase